MFDVTFHDAADLDQSLIEAEYRRKYHRRPAYNLNRAAGSTATLRLLPVRCSTQSWTVLPLMKEA